MLKKGIEAHNEVIKEIVKNTAYAKLYYMDMDNVLEKGKDSFDDICHLTGEGSMSFARQLIPVIIKEMHDF